MRKIRWLAKAAITAGILALQVAGSPQDRQSVPDLSLRINDIQGRSQTPFQRESQVATVLFFITQDCPISNRYAPEISRLVQEYQPKKIRFFLVYVDPAATNSEIAAHLGEYSLPMIPALHDSKHILVAAAGATVTPEAAVIGKQGEILYRGRIDNLYAALGRPRRNVTEHDLRNAIDAILQNRSVPVARTQAIGCYISSPNN